MLSTGTFARARLAQKSRLGSLRVLGTCAGIEAPTSVRLTDDLPDPDVRHARWMAVKQLIPPAGRHGLHSSAASGSR